MEPATDRSADTPVRIAGAGPAGLAAAIELARRGRPVELFERHRALGGRFDGDHQILPLFGDRPHGDDLLRELGVDDLDVVPLREARFLDGDGRVVEAHSREPYALLVRRGPAPGTLDRTLSDTAERLGVRFHVGRALAPERADVVATGLRRVDGLAIERMFRTASPDRVDVLLDETLAPGGYAYLFVDRGEATLGIAALGAFKDLGARLERARTRFAALGEFDEDSPRSAAHGMNFTLPATALDGGRPRVGEAAGFQDFLFGLGLRMALVSGRLAGQALDEDLDYDALWNHALGRRMRASLVDRWVYERGLVRRALFARLRHDDLREVLTSLQRDHWAKRLAHPWIRRARLRHDPAEGFVPRRPVEGGRTP